MEKEQQIKQRFLNTVKDHSMEIMKDEGMYRHLRFSNNGSYIYSFDLVTWPGHLSIGGDIGYFVFCRTEDMFKFFTQGYGQIKEGAIYINPQYWSEKCAASSNPCTEYSKDELISNIRYHFNQYDFESKRKKSLVWKEIKENLLPKLDDGETRAYDAVHEFESEHVPEFNAFRDHWEWDNTEYSTQFLMCCCAIYWGIQQYDAHKVQAVAA